MIFLHFKGKELPSNSFREDRRKEDRRWSTDYRSATGDKRVGYGRRYGENYSLADELHDEYFS